MRPDPVFIYHIVHLDKLAAIIADGHLYSDAIMRERAPVGSIIGMENIKNRRIGLPLRSYPDLHVGNCVPFYFCPRSVMLYVIYRQNHPELAYKGGQEGIVHLEANIYKVVDWARQSGLRWVFTTSNAGSSYFEDYCSLNDLNKINWQAVQAIDWSSCKEEKQAEFLVESRFPWQLVERIGVVSENILTQVSVALKGSCHRPDIKVRRDWYY